MIAVEGVLIGLLFTPGVQFDNKIGVGLFATVPAFAITIVQLVRTQQVQRASYIKEFLSEFRRNDDLYTAYYDLVYRFTDETYAAVCAIADQHIAEKGRPATKDRPSFDCFAELQVLTEPGRRFFHPLFFQFSPEEKKFDGLLDYFNSLGLYVYEGLVRVEDVVTVLGDYLAVVADRDVVQHYLKLCSDPEEWRYDDTVGASTPFRHLRYLLESYKEYNLHAYNKKKDEQLQQAIRAKEQEVAALKDKLKSHQ